MKQNLEARQITVLIKFNSLNESFTVYVLIYQYYDMKCHGGLCPRGQQV